MNIPLISSLVGHLRPLTYRLRCWWTARHVKIILGPDCGYETCVAATRNLIELRVRINGARDAHVRFVTDDGIGVCEPDDCYLDDAPLELIPWTDIKKIYVY